MAGWASGSGLTRWSSQGWAHDQILSLIWRRFTRSSPSALSLPLILPAGFPRDVSVSLSLSPNYPRQLSLHPAVDFSVVSLRAPFRNRDRSVKPHTLSMEYIKVPSFLSLQTLFRSFRSVRLALSLSVSLVRPSRDPPRTSSFCSRALTFDRRTLIAITPSTVSLAGLPIIKNRQRWCERGSARDIARLEKKFLPHGSKE